MPEVHLGRVGSMFSVQVKVQIERASAAFGLTGAVLECTGAAFRLHRGSPPSVPELHLGHVGSMFSSRARCNRARARCKPYVAQVKVHPERASAAFGLTGAVLEWFRMHRGRIETAQGVPT